MLKQFHGFLLVIVVTTMPAVAETQDKPPGRAEQLDALAKSTFGLEGFGAAIVREVAAKAAEAARRSEGKDSFAVDVTFRVREMPPKYSPDPTSIDVCWEMCGSLGCYLACSNPFKLGAMTGGPMRDCVQISDTLMACKAELQYYVATPPAAAVQAK